MVSEIFWHALSVKEVIEKLKTDPITGLAETEVKRRQIRFGKNFFPEKPRLTKLTIFLNQAKNPLVYILLAAGVLSLILKDYADSAIIFGVILFNFAIGFFQENKTEKVLAALKKIIRVKAFVLKGGNKKEVEQEELVLGDIIILSPGIKIPADARLIESQDLRINEFALTGEWLSAKKNIEVLKQEAPLADRDNMVYTGTIVESGKGKAVVTATGVKTEMGKLIEMVKETKEEKTPYQKKVIHFSQFLGISILFFCFLIFLFGIFTGKNYLEMLLTAVAIAVAAVPEGLPAAVTVTFAFGMQEILKRKGLVRKMIAAETLGSTSIIAADKTGTITEAKMEVSNILTGYKELFENELGKSPEKNLSRFKLHILALKIAVWCNEAFVENPDDSFKRYIFRGRPTDKALLMAGLQAGLDRRKLEKEEPKIDELGFDSVVKYSASLHRISKKKAVLYVLGAPEVILENTKEILIGENRKEILSQEQFSKLKEKTELLAKNGQRILAAAYKEIKNIGNKKIKIREEINNLVFVGFIGLRDPIRKDAKKAIEFCRRAGMKPIIITGDHRLTAKAVAAELGMFSDEKNIMEGKELDKISDEDLLKKVADIEIYCRVEPRHKIRIIEAWQERGEIVAMTGDGVNDAPALKKANIGIALGSGTEAAKEASDLILLDDSFSVVITAVEEGRRIMDNIRKIITYLLTGGFTEIMLIGFSVLFHFPLPVLPSQILWKNLIESTPPSMALTFEAEEPDIMDRKPEDPRHPLLNNEMKFLVFVVGLLTNLILFGLFLWFYHKNFPIERIRSIMFVGLAIDSFFFIFSCRNLRKNIWQYNPFANYCLDFIIIFAFLMIFVSLYAPFFQTLLKTVSLGLFEWFVLLMFGLLNLILIELAKWYFIRFKKI